jgi:hypothetical protein
MVYLIYPDKMETSSVRKQEPNCPGHSSSKEASGPTTHNQDYSWTAPLQRLAN